MARTVATKEAIADLVIGMGDWFSLHTGDPGTTGASEATGGSPAYARKQTTWSADAVDDGVRAGTQVTFDVPAGTYTHSGQWSASTSGTFVQGVALPTPIVMSVQGTIKLTPTYTES